MRILKLRFLNLNSLVGEWEIDFTNPAYADEGIFAITGATGAGKSTILDAICLALYGATPRLGDITQNKNDLMSRQTGECESEVIFATQSGTYRCHWGQKRARKHPEGKLQSPKHEIAEFISDDIDGKILEEKASRTKSKVEAITGMDFYRFTRAMLLAQGSFAAFLQASSDERSPILEQITGTEIYSEISKKVHEFKTNSEIALKSDKDKLSGMNLLPPEEEQTLTEKKAELIELVSQTKAKIAVTEKDKAWRDALNQCREKLTNLNQIKADLQQKVLVFAPEQSRLQRALKALTIKSDVEQLRTLRQQITKQSADLLSYQQQLPATLSDCQTAKKQLDTNHANLQLAETALAQALPLFNYIRELDTKQAQQHQQWQDITDQLFQINAKISTNQQTTAQHQRQLNQLKDEQQQNLAQLTHIPNAENLQPSLATLSQLQENTHELTQEQTHLTQEHNRLTRQHAEAEQHSQTLLQNLEQLTTKLEVAKAEQQAIESELTKLTDGQSLGELRQQTEQLWQAQNLANAIKQDISDWQHNLETASQHHAELATINNQLTSLEQNILITTTERQHTEQRLDLLNRNLRLLAKIESLTQERDRLVSGEPCPLCGSTEHPFATHNPSDIPNQTEQELAQAKHQFDTLNQQIQNLNLEKNTLQNQQQFLQQAVAQFDTQNQQLASQSQANLINLPNAQSLIKSLASVTKLSSKNTIDSQKVQTQLYEFANQLMQLQQALSEQTNQLQQRLNAVENQQNAFQAAQQHVVKLNEQYNQQHQKHTIMQSEQQHRLERIGELEQLLATLTDRHHKLQQRIEDIFSPFITPHTQASFAKALGFDSRFKALQQLWQQFQQLNQRTQQLNDQISQTNHTLASLTAESENLQANLQQWQQRQLLTNEQLQQLTAERQQKFGDKHIETEENQLNQAKNQAFQMWRQSEQALAVATQSQQRLQQNIDTLTVSIAQLKIDQQKAQFQVTEQFTKLGFHDEADYQSATLSDTEREQLQRQASELAEQQQRNDSLLTQAKNEEQALLVSPRSELSATQLGEQLDTQKHILSEAEQQLGGVDTRLLYNQQQKQDQSELLKQIEEKSLHAKEWKDLHDLIGSSDGKKFRNFAQGLTFNIMISHANEQLKKMSDRYLLLADEKEPLMLNVMDNYQGGEIRTSKNLSGGESFIISLSLALGLSNMASHRMQVDSLFLDEGFGTLDEEALDVALDTLTGLQQSGKLIGVISHIQALKDRISSQIQVVPQTGGVSKIVGAGVKKVS